MSPGEQVLDFIHIDDVVDFYRTLLSNLGSCRNSYNEIHIGTGAGSTPKKIAGLMEAITEKKANINWGGMPYRPNDTMFSVAPKELSGHQIGWQPSLTIEEGIRLYIKEKQRDDI
jgi:CDP-paratose synthetase